MKITRRSFVKKSSFSAAVVTILGAGVALAANGYSSNPKGEGDGRYEMKCASLKETITQPAELGTRGDPYQHPGPGPRQAKASSTFVENGKTYRYLLELQALSSVVEDEGWYTETAFSVEAGPWNNDQASGTGTNATLYKHEGNLDNNNNLVWTDEDQWNCNPSGQLGSLSGLLFTFDRKIDNDTGDVTTVMNPEGLNKPPVHGPLENGLPQHTLKLEATVAPSPVIKDSVTVTFKLTASNLPIPGGATTSLTATVPVTVTHVGEEKNYQ